MGHRKIKIGESTLVVNEKGQLCELVNIPSKVIKHYKGKILEVDENENIEAPVDGLIGKLGNIYFLTHKKSHGA